VSVSDPGQTNDGAYRQPDIQVLIQVLAAKSLLARAVRSWRVNRPLGVAAASNAEIKEYAAKALFRRALRLGELERFDEEDAALDKVVECFGESGALEIQRIVALALGVKGLRTGQRGLTTASLAAYDNLIARFAHSEDSFLQERVIEALMNKSVTLRQLGCFDQEIRACDDAMALFIRSEELPLRQKVADVMLGKAQRLEQLGQPNESIADYWLVVTRFGDAWELSLQEPVSIALNNLAQLYRRLGLTGERIACDDELVRRYADARHPVLRERAAAALTDKGIARGITDNQAALRIYEQVLERYGCDEEAEVQRAVAYALSNKAIALGELNRIEESVCRFRTGHHQVFKFRVCRNEEARTGKSTQLRHTAGAARQEAGSTRKI
jgi:tetratricopeptide (TPR) repeat protein